MSSYDIDSKKLNAIVGAALKALAESGASAEFIGEFAVSHRQHVAGVLGYPTASQEPPSLEAIVSQVVAQTLAATTQGKTPKQKTKERVTIMLDGKKTSLSLDALTLAKWHEANPSKKQSLARIASLASAAPPEVNRSEWVSAKLLSYLNTPPAPGSASIN